MLGFGDFRVDGGNLAQCGVDVLGFDRGSGGTGGGDPCGLGQEVEDPGVALAGLGQQIDRGWREDVAIQAGAADMPVEVGGDVLAGQRGEHGGGTHAGEEGALDREAQTAEQVFVAEQDESEGAALATPQAQEHADFLERRAGIILGVVESEHESERIDIGEVFFQDHEVGAAFEAGAFAELGEKDFENAGGRRAKTG